jgi:preprotein translocase subunit YajC
LFTPAFAQAAGAPGGTDMLMQIVPFALIFVIMYVLIIRPQQKRAKEHQALIENVRRGDTVIMTGGLIGKVTKVAEGPEIEIEIADNVKVKIIRTMIAEVRSKSEPVKSEDYHRTGPNTFRDQTRSVGPFVHDKELQKHDALFPL